MTEWRPLMKRIRNEEWLRKKYVMRTKKQPTNEISTDIIHLNFDFYQFIHLSASALQRIKITLWNEHTCVFFQPHFSFCVCVCLFVRMFCYILSISLFVYVRVLGKKTRKIYIMCSLTKPRSFWKNVPSNECEFTQ